MEKDELQNRMDYTLRSDNDWREYRKLVLFQLKTLTDEVEKLEKETQSLRTYQTAQKAISSMLGAIAGGSVIIVELIIKWLGGK